MCGFDKHFKGVEDTRGSGAPLHTELWVCGCHHPPHRGKLEDQRHRLLYLGDFSQLFVGVVHSAGTRQSLLSD